MQSKKKRHAYWETVLAKFEKSSLSQEKFCAENKISFRHFKYYRHALKKLKLKEMQPLLPTPLDFAPVHIKPTVASSTAKKSLHFILPNGTHCFFPADIPSQQLKAYLEPLLCHS